MPIILLPLLIFFAFLIFVAVLYNTLIMRKNGVKNAFAGVDAYLKKRYDLIPNLVATARTYMGYERETLERITGLRTKALSTWISDEDKMRLDRKISEAIGGVMVAVESYPDLKSDRNFLHLQKSLNEIEEQISAARRAYNAAVTSYNNAVEMFPTNILAGLMKCEKKSVFEADGQERRNVKVGDLFS